jgi:predicted lipid-binding transport protein (Tim44 family)
MMVVGMIFAAYAGVAIFVWRSVRNRRRVQEGGLISRLRWKPRADRARALLDEVSRLDRELAPTTILERFRETFLRLQHCWSEQEYSGMADLMTAQLYQEHLEKLAVQVSAGERNVLEGIVIRECEVVCVRYWAERDRREIAVLFEVSMVDYFANRETGAFLRGRRTPSTFQEVWWFRLGFGGWRLSKIEQTAETSVLEMTDVNEVPISAGSGNGL